MCRSTLTAKMLRSGRFLSRWRLGVDQGIARAPAAALFLLKQAQVDQILDVAKRGVVGALLKLCPLRRCELSLETIEQTVHDVALPLVVHGEVLDQPNTPG